MTTDDYYDVDTSGSPLLVVLSVLDGACAGRELRCSAADSTLPARLVVRLESFSGGQSTMMIEAGLHPLH